jgi:isoquinoline 1-oxidoreductase beta subunit
MPMKLSRRSFLHSAGLAGGILLLDVRVPLRAADGAATQIIAGWIRIDPDGHLCLLMNATEMGQGAQSGLAQILAEELDLDWSQVRVDFAPIDREHYGMWETYQTGGSGSIRGMFDRLRKAGATARAMLMQAAAQRWGVPAEECVTRSGYVRHAQSSRSASYVTLARDAARLSPPKNVPLKARGDWQLIGKSTPRLDVRSRSTAPRRMESMCDGLECSMPPSRSRPSSRARSRRSTTRRRCAIRVCVAFLNSTTLSSSWPIVSG